MGPALAPQPKDDGQTALAVAAYHQQRIGGLHKKKFPCVETAERNVIVADDGARGAFVIFAHIEQPEAQAERDERVRSLRNDSKDADSEAVDMDFLEEQKRDVSRIAPLA